MSASNAAAIRRRAANASQEERVSQSITTSQPVESTKRPKSIAEMVVILNKRVNDLEKNSDLSGNNIPQELLGVIQEYNMRFDIIAEEISVLKDTVIKLQTYTMDVNKMLLNERIQILSDVSMSKPETIEVSTETQQYTPTSTSILSEISLDTSNTSIVQTLDSDSK
jgi:hypothetical protein